MQYGYHCGMIWGAALAAGARAYHLLGAGPQAETAAIMASQRLVAAFRAHNNRINCLDITGIDQSSSNMQMTVYFFVKGGVIKCMRMAAEYAPTAFAEINAALTAEHIAAPAPPVSCAALLMHKLGASEMHTVMAASLAGGIGLCGGACGALGAAIWLMGLNNLQAGGKIDFKPPEALEVMDKFAECTNNEFECAAIVGRKFADVADHAAYLRDGGCAEIIDLLATT